MPGGGLASHDIRLRVFARQRRFISRAFAARNLHAVLCLRPRASPTKFMHFTRACAKRASCLRIPLHGQSSLVALFSFFFFFKSPTPPLHLLRPAFVSRTLGLLQVLFTPCDFAGETCSYLLFVRGFRVSCADWIDFGKLFFRVRNRICIYIFVLLGNGSERVQKCSFRLLFCIKCTNKIGKIQNRS